MARKNIEKQNVLEQVETVSVKSILDSIYNSKDYDNIYEHFVCDKAYHTGFIPNKDIYSLLEECYMDWFFLALHQNVRNMPHDLAKCYSQLKTYRDFHPSNMKGKDYFNFFKTKASGLFKADKFLPIEIVKTSEGDESFIVSIYTDTLHFMSETLETREVRLYLNIKGEFIIPVVKEVLHRSYSESLPMKINFTNSDNRADTIILCTDYMHANATIDMIRNIREDFTYMFEDGVVPELLGSIDDFIGFGEQPKNNNTYFSERANAFTELFSDSIDGMLAKLLTRESSAKIVNRNNDMLSVDEYLYELVKRTTLSKIESMLSHIQAEDNEPEDGKRKESVINMLYALRTEFRRDDISKENEEVMKKEVAKLKESMTRSCDYTLRQSLVVDNKEIDVKSDYDFISKLFRTFANDKMCRLVDKEDKKTMSRLINSIIYPISHEKIKRAKGDTVTIEVVLYDMFKEALLKELKIKVNTLKADSDIATQNRIFANYKSRELKRYIKYLNKIDSDDDEGKNYVYDAIYDYLRALIEGKVQDVEVWLDENTKITLIENFKEKLYNMFPELNTRLTSMLSDKKFYEDVLLKYDINPNNIALNSNTLSVNYVKSSSAKRSKTATVPELEDSILNVDIKGVNDESTYSSATDYYSSL